MMNSVDKYLSTKVDGDKIPDEERCTKDDYLGDFKNFIGSYGELPINDFFRNIKEICYKTGDSCLDNFFIQESNYGDGYWYSIYHRRPETDQEYNQRMFKINKQKMECEEKERKMLAILKAKYERNK